MYSSAKRFNTIEAANGEKCNAFEEVNGETILCIVVQKRFIQLKQLMVRNAVHLKKFVVRQYAV